MYTDDNAVAVEIRKRHINHEAAVRSVGMLYYIGASLLGMVGLVSLIDGKQGALIGLLFVVLSALYFMVGRWFRVLNPKARVPGTILAALGLLGFPIATLVNAYILYLIHSEKGKVVFSDNYQAVIEATPGVKRKTSIVVWILLGIFVLFIVAIMVFALTRK